MKRFSFAGGTGRGYELLKALISKNNIPLYAVILKEDDHESEKYSAKISELLNSRGVPFNIRKKLTEEDHKSIMESGSDVLIVFGWRTLIDTENDLNLKEGIVASHFSLLPKYRGFAPVQWAIINGDTESGVTLFQINDGDTDSGKIIKQMKIPILHTDHASDVDRKMTDCAVDMFMNYLNNTVSYDLIDQNESEATYTCKRIPEDGRINWQKSSNDIYNLIRAVAYPYPGAFCFYEEKKYLINRARIGDMDLKVFSGRVPGRVLKADEEGVEVMCGTGTVKLLEWSDEERKVFSNPNKVLRSLTGTLK